MVFAALVLFPFDLLLSGDEWAAKLHGGGVAWFIALTDTRPGIVRLLAKLLVETAAVVPLGAWWVSRQVAAAGRAAAPWGRALGLGLLLGLVIEALQLGLASGVSQGLSVLTRGLGFAAGALLWRHADGIAVEALRAGLRRITGWVVPVYLPLLTVQFGWWRGAWMPIDSALQRLQHEIHFTPLYYHYYTSEATALVSLLAVLSSYAPVGLLGWGWHLGAGTSALLAAALALLIEAGRLMVAETKPDPSNLLIAAAAAGLAHALLRRLAAGLPGTGRGRA
jgi:hypothetical protein